MQAHSIKPSQLLQTAQALREGALKVAEHVRESLETIESRKKLNAFISVHSGRAQKEARDYDHRLNWGQSLGPLHGVAVAIKDNIDEAGEVCSAGCRAYRDRRPQLDAEIVRRLRAKGAIVVGRTNMHELADGVTSENSFYGPVHNPLREGYHPGGSSGGSAVAVRTGMVPVALGTDTGGSVRVPASLCGIVGFKPSAGVLPTLGVVPLSTTLDHVGPLARTVQDAAAMTELLSGSGSSQYEGRYVSACNAASDSQGRLTLGVIRGFALDADAEVGLLFEQTLARLERLGLSIKEVKIPGIDNALKILARIYGPEAASFHREKMLTSSAEFSMDIYKDLERGLAQSPEKYSLALQDREQLKAAINEAFEDVDFLISPTTPHTARPFGSKDAHTYLTNICPFNLSGHPSLSLPMGEAGGLPAGLQLVGGFRHDINTLALGAQLEAACS